MSGKIITGQLDRFIGEAGRHGFFQVPPIDGPGMIEINSIPGRFSQVGTVSIKIILGEAADPFFSDGILQLLRQPAFAGTASSHNGDQVRLVVALISSAHFNRPVLFANTSVTGSGLGTIGGGLYFPTDNFPASASGKPGNRIRGPEEAGSWICSNL